MFERYTERARRVIFFARYEASQFGSMTIETEHLLLGLLREDPNMIDRFTGQAGSTRGVRDDVTARLLVREKVATSIDLPLSEGCMRILAYAAEETERLNHRHIGTEHLLLGMMREENSMAAQVLQAHGLQLNVVREKLARASMPAEPYTAGHSPPPLFPALGRNPALPESGVVPDAETAKRIAEAIWLPLYGAETIANLATIRAELNFNVWLVTSEPSPEGVLYAYILQADGRILSVGRGPVARS